MRYAEKQHTRPQHEGGCDYGHGRRSVLVQNGKQQLLHIAGSKHWGGIGAGRNYSPSEIVIYPDKRGPCQQQTLEEGRMTKEKWAGIAEQIYSHLGIRFSLELISLKHTLLLDEPGAVIGPPLDIKGPKKSHPKIESDRFYRIFLDDDGKCKLIEFPIIKQTNGVIVYKLPNGHELDKRTKYLIEDGAAGTIDGAVEAYLQRFKDQVAETTERLLRASDRSADARDNLAEAKHRIEAMLKE